MLALDKRTMPERLRQGLVAYWPLATAGAVDLKSALYDGRGPYDLTNNNTVTRGAGPSANLPDAANFVAGSLQRLVNPSLLVNTTRPFSWTGFVYAAASQAQSVPMVVGFWGAAGNRAWNLSYVDASQRLIISATTDGSNVAATASPTLALTDATFYFVHVYWTGSIFGIQINNGIDGSVAEAAFTGPLFASTSGFSYGGNGQGALYYSGRIAASALWVNRALPTYSTLWLYNNGQGRDLTRGV